MKTPAALTLLLPLVLLPMGHAKAQPQQPQPATQVVVLRNGNVLEGQVDQLPGTYRVITATSEIRLAARDVERLAPSLLGAYDAKRAEVRPDSASDHLQLASWCVRQELWPQAARELNDAGSIDGNHPLLPVIDRRLQVAVRAAQRASERLPTRLPENEEAATQQRASELAELEALAASLPEGALESFARQVQPILVNGCAAASCHGTQEGNHELAVASNLAQAGAFRLNRDSLRGVGTRESTLRNLQAAWQAIDHENPVYSPLLMQPAVPHGGLARPVFAGNRQRLQDTLREWVLTATAKPEPPAAEVDLQVELAGHISQGPLSPHGHGTSAPGMHAPGTDLAAEQVAAPQAGERHFWELDEELGAPQPKVRYGAKLKPYQPRDEFDPELFNRRHAANDEVGQSPAEVEE